jgi:hypothetical protein
LKINFARNMKAFKLQFKLEFLNTIFNNVDYFIFINSLPLNIYWSRKCKIIVGFDAYHELRSAVAQMKRQKHARFELFTILS